MNITQQIIYYLGMILFLGGIISAPILSYKVYKKRDKFDNFKELVSANLSFILIPFLAFLLGFILLNYAFFINPTTIEHLNKKNLTVSTLSNFLVYGIGTLFVVSLFSTFYSLITSLYLEKFNISKLKRGLWFGISLVLTILSFSFYTEGLAPYLIYPLANALYIGKEGILLINIYTKGDNYTQGLAIYLYAIFILAGACLVLFVADYKIYKIYGKHDLITNTFLIAFPAGIIGARIWFVILSVSRGESTFVGENWVNIFNFREGGLGIMGGAILGIIAGVSQMLYMKYIKKHPDYVKMNYLNVADIIVPCILFAQAIGRIGNFFNNEVFGFPVDGKYFSFLPSFIYSNMNFSHGSYYPVPEGQIVLPLFFIELCTNLIGYFVLTYLFNNSLFFKPINKIINLFRKEEDVKNNPNILEHSDGSLVGGYILWYGITRAILEPLRNSNDHFRTSEITSYVMIAGGILLIIAAIINNYVIKRKKLLWYKENEKEASNL